MRLEKSGTIAPTTRPQNLRSCSSCYSRASRFPSRSTRTIRCALRGLPMARLKPGNFKRHTGSQGALGLSRHLTPQQLLRPLTTARSPISSCGARCRRTTSFSYQREQFMQLARASSLRSSNSATMRHSACSIMAGSVNFISKSLAVAATGAAHFQVRQSQPTPQRRLSFPDSHFVLERIDLAPNSHWRLEAERETWFLVLGGRAIAGSFDIATGEALFAKSDHIDIQAGASGWRASWRIPAAASVTLLQRLTQPGSIHCRATTDPGGGEFS